MNCPIDNTPLTLSERNGIEIDYCPQCRGVWLDRGELDKIIERSDSYSASGPPSGDWDRGYRGDGYDGHYGHDGHGYGQGYRQGGRRRGGFLGDLFG